MFNIEKNINTFTENIQNVKIAIAKEDLNVTVRAKIK